jgi:broad specificity phosphatase PhoE
VERLILARHGESDYSARGLVNGDASVHVGLTAAGERQAVALGRALAGEPLDLCVTSALERTRATAALALRGRDVPVLAWPGLNDPRAGRFEGLDLGEYRAWAWAAGAREPAPGAGESRLEAVSRYAAAYRALLALPEADVLAVVHALPIAYLLSALDGLPPAARMELPVAHAHPYRVGAAALIGALAVLESWCAAPSW